MSATPKSLSFILVLQTLILGCGGNNSNVPNPPSPSMPAFSDDLTINGTETGQTIEFQGVKFETPPSSDNPNDTNISGNSVTFKWGGVSGQFKSGSLTIEGSWYGNIDRGDIVTLSADGAVRINGQVRNVTSPSTYSSGGIRFSFSGQHGNASFSNGEGEITDMFGRKCVIRQGTFFVDGKSFGSIGKGDEVTLSADGSVAVNGETRESQ